MAAGPGAEAQQGGAHTHHPCKASRGVGCARLLQSRHFTLLSQHLVFTSCAYQPGFSRVKKWAAVLMPEWHWRGHTCLGSPPGGCLCTQRLCGTDGQCPPCSSCFDLAKLPKLQGHTLGPCFLLFSLSPYVFSHSSFWEHMTLLSKIQISKKEDSLLGGLPFGNKQLSVGGLRQTCPSLFKTWAHALPSDSEVASARERQEARVQPGDLGIKSLGLRAFLFPSDGGPEMCLLDRVKAHTGGECRARHPTWRTAAGPAGASP